MVSNPTGWQSNPDGTHSPPDRSVPPHTHLEAPPQTQHTVIRDGELLVRDASGVLRVLIGKDGSDFDVKVYDAAGANPVKLSTLAFGVQAADIETNQTTVSTTFADLATVGPAATALIGPSGKAIVFYGANVGAGDLEQPEIAFAISGATTVAADPADKAFINVNAVGDAISAAISRATVVTGLNAGSNTFTLKYRETNGNLVAFSHRWIVVFPY